MAQRTHPISKPNQLPGAIYRTSQQRVTTLQEQMCLQNDLKTFREFTRLMKQRMDTHLRIGMGYKWQDPGLLEEVREEVLVQCPALEERYDDAWPITSYLRLSLSQRKPLDTYQKHTPGRKSRSKRSQTNHKLSAVSSRLILDSRTGKNPTSVGTANLSVESRSKRVLRRSTRLTKRDKTIFASTEVSMAHEDDEDVEAEETEGGTSPTNNADPEVGSNSASDSEGALPLRLSCGSPGSGYKSKIQGDNHQHVRTEGLRPVRRSPYRARNLSQDLDLPNSSPTLSTSGTTHDAAPRAEHLRDGLVVVSQSLASRTSTPQPSDIENMLLSRGLPLTDSRRITHLLSSLGIVDKTYLHVFARLAPSREAWLSEMRRKGQLSEVQAWVIVDMLDTVTMD